MRIKQLHHCPSKTSAELINVIIHILCKFDCITCCCTWHGELELAIEGASGSCRSRCLCRRC
jgi:hypothetical protein